MSARWRPRHERPSLTDAQISRALRAHVPERAQAGLRERILKAAETTTQQRALPSFLGALGTADPVTRRRSLLIAAALLVALALGSAAAAGALRLLERSSVQNLSLEPPTDLQAFVLSSYDRLPELPPVAMTWLDDGSTKGRIYVHRSGAVRFDRFASAEATEPSTYTILSGDRLSGMAIVGSDEVWVEQDEAIGEDPRVFLRTVLSPGPIIFEGPGCEMERDPSGIGNGTAATGWRYVGVEYVAGRPAHHVACVGDLWLDIETRLILRIRGLLPDDAGQPIPGEFRTIEVIEIAFGEQPAALFEPPEGVARMPIGAYYEYLCTRDPVLPHEVVGFAITDCSAPPPPDATPLARSTPKPSVPPSPSHLAVPSAGVSATSGELTWSPASLNEDWPAPVRPEQDGGAIVLPQPELYPDPSGDTGSAVHPWVDIRELQLHRTFMFIHLVTNVPPAVDPTEQWIAYGVVVDSDRDGVPDWRYGIDNIPVEATGERPHRAWRTDLHTGRTESAAGPGYGYVGETYFDTWFPGEAGNGDGARLGFGGDSTGPDDVDAVTGLLTPFYAWASVIENGRVVASDYAPDVGWLDPSAEANP